MFNACWAKHVECTTLLYLGDFTVGLNAWFPPVLFRISVKPIDSSLVVLNAVGSPTKDLRVLSFNKWDANPSVELVLLGDVGMIGESG